MLYYVANPKAAESRSSLERGGAMLTESEEKLLTNWLRLKEQTTKTNQQRPPVNEKEWVYCVSRYKPTIHDVILNLSTGSLGNKDYPFLIKEEESEAPKAKSNDSQSKKKAPASTWSGPNESHKKQGPRIIIFIAGGVSYSEIRIAHTLTQPPYNLDIVLGSTHIVEPPRFLKQVAALTSSVDDEAYKSVTMPSGENQTK